MWNETLKDALLIYRERQDADGQMKELQDQFEAEQYFSVSPCLCFVLLKRGFYGI